jgi:hypothetical protein
MKRPQESSLNRSAKARMRDPVATAIRTMPLRCLTDPLHGLNSPDQLPHLSIPFASRSFASNGSLLRLEQSNSTAQEIFEFAVLFRDFLRRFQRPSRCADSRGYPPAWRSRLQPLTGEYDESHFAQLLRCNGGEPAGRERRASPLLLGEAASIIRIFTYVSNT